MTASSLLGLARTYAVVERESSVCTVESRVHGRDALPAIYRFFGCCHSTGGNEGWHLLKVLELCAEHRWLRRSGHLSNNWSARSSAITRPERTHQVCADQWSIKAVVVGDHLGRFQQRLCCTESIPPWTHSSSSDKHKPGALELCFESSNVRLARWWT